MNDPEEFARFTGMPTGRKKTRRGRRARKGGKSPHLCLNDAHTALAKGDTAGVKAAAFALIKALPAAERPAVESALVEADVLDTPKAPKAGPSGAAKLAALLRTKKRTT